ncbi:MAG: chemotaxis protein CheW [Acidimicrobiia bacterium]
MSPVIPDSGADQVLVLEADGERYAVELTSVERVHPVDAVTPLPGLRPPWAGLVCLRGEMFPALDLPSYLGKPPPGGPLPPVDCAVVTHGGLRVAFLSEAPVALLPRPEGGVILDVATILADPGLVVND